MTRWNAAVLMLFAFCVMVVVAGTVPSSLCGLTLLNTLYIWSNGSPTDNSGINCKRSCLSSKTGMSYAPSGLSQCPLTVVPAASQQALCDFIAATDISYSSGYSDWQCTAAHTVVTQPCEGTSTIWSGITACTSTGDIAGISLSNAGIIGIILVQQ